MTDSPFSGILTELNRTLSGVSSVQLADTAALILKSKRIFLAGAGRSGLMLKAFAMRLMHLGISAFIVGETTTPGIQKGDLLIIGSGSGRTESLLLMANRAKEKYHAQIVVITASRDSLLEMAADTTIRLNAPTPKDPENKDFKSIQPMGSLFEQCLFLLADRIIIELMGSTALSSEDMFKNHANLE